MGPRFLIPKRFRPDHYEYVRTFVEMEDLEASQLTPNAPDLSVECIICMNSLRHEVDDNMVATNNHKFTNIYMETPCKHKFHKKCLIHWMRIKLECPVCRTNLPPLEDD